MINFNQKYNRQEFLGFLNSFLPDDFVEDIKENIETERRFQKIKKVHQLGEVESLGTNRPLRIYEVEHTSENDPRVTLTREAFWLLSAEHIRRALIVFVSKNSDNYRFSLMTIDLKDEGRRVRQEYSNPRRYSFYLGPDAKVKTPTDFLIKKGKVEDFDDLLSRFDVEVVTKEFFEELSNWYFWAIKETRFPSDAEKEKNGRNIAIIRMITRLIFIWFMKQKGLVPEYLFEKNEINEILKDLSDNESTYYKAILQNLFFATLNTPEEKRGFRNKKDYHGRNKDFMRHDIYRYENYFQKPKEILSLFKDIPFLNGGLFECLDKKVEDGGKKKYIRIDGFSDRADNPLKVPNFLFFSSERTIDLNREYGTKGKKYKVEGLINILKRYNFTIDENTPLDVDVALDPELLGRVFENLLASFNPETSTTARKATGSYYTPRPIVDYMVDESLKAYFKTKIKTKDIDKKLEELFSYSIDTHSFSDQEGEELIKAISQVKIIDPAVGSGAFPMGILQRLVHLLSKLDPDNELWKQEQIEAIQKNVLDVSLKKKLIQKIEDDFKNYELDYGRKLYLIQNCIYGVDIQPIAIEICKLRFFISLLVDMKTGKIEPLPNLETKFVAANSLIGLTRQVRLKSGKVIELENQLKKIRNEYFDANYKNEKRFLRNKDKEIREQLADSLKQIGFPPENSQKIAEWDPYDTNTSANWFDPEWMFGVIDGFDIVIGNPPYIQLQKNGGELAKLYQDAGFETFARTGDIYCLFYEKGNQFLKNNGHLVFITSNKWMRAGYGEKLRKYLADNTTPKLLIDLGPGVFESATVDTNILLFQKGKRNEKCMACNIQENLAKSDISLREYVEKNKVELENFTSDAWVILSPIEQRIKEKIEKIGIPLKDWDIKINRGVLTGFNEAFIIDSKKKDELIKKDPQSAEIIKPILRGKDIGRYYVKFADKWLIASHNGYKKGNREIVKAVNIKKYPAIKEWLDRYWEEIFKRQDQGETPYNLRDCAYWQEFEKEKIVWGNIGYNSNFAFDKGSFINAPANLLTSKKHNVKYILAIMNSKIFSWEFENLGISLGHAFEWKKQYVERIHVPQISRSKQKPFIKLVDQILKITSQPDYNPNNPPVKQKELEAKIDKLVYGLYGLSEEEIKIVENYG